MIRFYSTLKSDKKASLKEAVMTGLASDGGLFMPDKLPLMPASFFQKIADLSFAEIALEVAKVLLEDTIAERDLETIVKEAFTFDAPLKKVSSGIYALELFHGPTLSFKDFGAAFMARLMRYFVQKEERTLNVLVATSGDTGSAIGHSFLHLPKTHVWILYPKGKVSLIQEKQLTTMGDNVTALEIEGTFDDCQRLVKQAFSDVKLRDKMLLTSANSINIARLIPQMFYYFNAYARLKDHSLPVVVSVPCGNFGNLTAGLFARRMGLPINHFVAATNINDSVPKYLKTGVFTPHPSQKTLSNAMDVGNPSNFGRMLDFYGHSKDRMKEEIFGISFTDDQTKQAINNVFKRDHYLLDPHGAIAYLGLTSYQKKGCNGIFLETADPAKFADDVEAVIKTKVPIPKRLQEVLSKEKRSIVLSPNYDALAKILFTS